MTYDELQTIPMQTIVEVRMPREKPRRGLVVSRVWNGNRAIRAVVIHDDNRDVDDYIPSIVHVLCPLDLLAEVV